MGCTASVPSDRDGSGANANRPRPGQHRYSCSDTECAGCCSQPRSPSSTAKRRQGTPKNLSNPTSLQASREAEYEEGAASSCPSRALSSRGSSCGEPSAIRVHLRQAKNIFVAKLFNDISEDPDQFDPEATPQYVLDDSRKAVVDSGWLDAVVAVITSDDDLESVRSFASGSRQSDAVISRTSGWCTATSMGCNSTSYVFGGEGSGPSSPLDRAAFPPGCVCTHASGAVSPTSTQASGGLRKPRHTNGSAAGSPLTERALLRLAQATERRPSGAPRTASTPALTPRLGVSL